MGYLNQRLDIIEHNEFAQPVCESYWLKFKDGDLVEKYLAELSIQAEVSFLRSFGETDAAEKRLTWWNTLKKEHGFGDLSFEGLKLNYEMTEGARFAVKSRKDQVTALRAELPTIIEGHYERFKTGEIDKDLFLSILTMELSFWRTVTESNRELQLIQGWINKISGWQSIFNTHLPSRQSAVDDEYASTTQVFNDVERALAGNVFISFSSGLNSILATIFGKES